MLQNFLQQIGLSSKEAEIYLILVQMGDQPVSVIAKKSHQTRTTVYSVLESLAAKGYATHYQKNKLRYYSPERPELILANLDKELREINLKKNRFRELLPEFQALVDKSTTIPKVRYFEGIEGIKAIYNDTLKDENYHHHARVKLGYSCALDGAHGDLLTFLKSYVKERTRLNINVKAIFPTSERARAVAAQDSKFLRESRLVPPKLYPFTSEINIYGNKIAFMSIKGPEFHGVIIESTEIANTERAIFELAWLGAGTLE